MGAAAAAAAAALAACGPALSAQVPDSASPAPAGIESGFEVALTDGRVLRASRLEGDPRSELSLTTGDRRMRVAAGELLAVHNVASTVVDLPSAWLAGGERVYGQLAGGDEAGDQLVLLSPVFGRVELRVDRVAAFAAAGVLRPLRFELPSGVNEAILQRASVGYDVVAGVLHRFGDQGVRFQPEGADAARWFSPSEFVAWRVLEATPRRSPAAAELVTRTGDRLGIGVLAFTAETVRCQLDGGEVVEVRLADLSCLSFEGVGTFLSDLEPARVDESGYEGEVVHPWQRDASATGGPLTTAGRTHAKGLGVQSRSRLEFRVPEGASSFWTRVGLDDSSANTGVLAEADVRVLVGGEVRFERRALTAGPPLDTGLLSVRPGQAVVLDVDFGRGRDIGDRVDWLSPVFLPGPGRKP
jgi:hypothetical protein